MSSEVMVRQTRELPPSRAARIAGLLYLLTFAVGGVAEFLSGRIFIVDDVASTAANILAHQRLFWLVFAAYLTVLACYAGVTVLLYDLLKPAGGRLSRVAAFFSLLGCAIQGSACVIYLIPLTLLSGVLRKNSV
jgi:hypothetical protein